MTTLSLILSSQIEGRLELLGSKTPRVERSQYFIRVYYLLLCKLSELAFIRIIQLVHMFFYVETDSPFLRNFIRIIWIVLFNFAPCQLHPRSVLLLWPNRKITSRSCNFKTPFIVTVFVSLLYLAKIKYWFSMCHIYALHWHALNVNWRLISCLHVLFMFWHIRYATAMNH